MQCYAQSEWTGNRLLVAMACRSNILPVEKTIPVIHSLKNMKHLEVAFLENCSCNASINEVSFFLGTVEQHTLNNAPWTGYEYKPKVNFAMAYGTDCLFLKYYVSETFLRAANGAKNSAVYEDSCVEFFISFENDKSYYNFEFNCIGTCLIGYGESKTDRMLLPEALISKVKYQAVISNQLAGDDIHWELTVNIPFSVFCYHKLKEVKGKNCRANFYKCGDVLPTPHFISWSPIHWPEPNFHLPECFGSLLFV